MGHKRCYSSTGLLGVTQISYAFMSYTATQHQPDSFRGLSEEVGRLIPEDCLENAKNITLGDLLSTDISVSECISLIENVSKYSRFYGDLDSQEERLLSGIRALKDHISPRCRKEAFSLIHQVKQTHKHGFDNPEVIRRIPGNSPPVQKPQLSLEDAKDIVGDFVEERRLANRTLISFDEIASFVESDYLENGKFQWSTADTPPGRNSNPPWKAEVSNALQQLKSQEIIQFLRKHDKWHILPE